MLINEDVFLTAIRDVASAQNLSSPEHAYWQCTDFSIAVMSVGKEIGIDISLYSCWISFKEKLGEIDAGEKVGHTIFKIGGTYYDFTYRQADPNSKFPLVFSSAPETHKRIVRFSYAAYDPSGPRFYISKIKKRLNLPD